MRFGNLLAEKARVWGNKWIINCLERLSPFFPQEKLTVLDGYLFTRTVPCPDTQYPIPLIPDWILLKKDEVHVW